jgi:hypothetical protein
MTTGMTFWPSMVVTLALSSVSRGLAFGSGKIDDGMVLFNNWITSCMYLTLMVN